eukprot:CAMPEP_0197872666 /NCGR_PEP_ID=MMETSP1439-20131203/2691_1 /TAXON_ID=66791 /ORGANISM="Gonyaulax spinifera, Strain CCMP409" /LENGTH=806 /DNA_ID=CAMNT_0043491671 /DNA_START=100 /DNA_END=2520 /DNA_ORIENTATION=+
MAHGMLVLPVQDARKYIDKIGKESSIQFEDMNAREMRRPFRKHIQRIDEMERIIRFIFEEVGKIEGCHVVKNCINEFFAADSMDVYKLDSLESELTGLYQHFMKFKENNAVLVDQRNHAVEEAQVATTALEMFKGTSHHAPASMEEEGFDKSARRPLVGREEGFGRLGYVSGVIARADEVRFSRALWRASSSNAFTQFMPIEKKVVDPKTGLEVSKSVFVVYFQGDQGYLHQKIVKVCQAFGVNMYAWPANLQKARERNDVLQQTLIEKERASQAYQSVMRAEAAELLQPVAEGSNSRLEDWRLFCIKEKSIYSILNMCQEGMHLRVDVWYPIDERKKIENLLESVNSLTKLEAILCTDKEGTHAKSTPPTYIRTNEYTEVFQMVINEYGIPKYQEANPALLSVVTFPFIFGMMYGDIGHGSLLLLAGLWLCYNSEKLRFSLPDVYRARFMVVSMGVFATFAGFMYNDMFSLGLQLFDSRFEDLQGNGVYTPKASFDPTNSGGGGPYPFGLDWAWQGAGNELLYVNSLKMKLSVLFGVLQMTVGVFLRWGNALHEKSLVDFICECLPMLVFLLCFFGWMDAMILYKWTHPIDNPPSIINSLICMAMGQEDKFPLWDGSVELSKKLMLFTVCAVPIMLLPKPFILLFQHNQKEKRGQKVQTEEALMETGAESGAHGHGEEFEFGEIFIHQIIETIEFVLGTVSHTASYLRIWALSLAHQQLSMVFFQKTIQNGLEMPYPVNGIVLFFMFGAWFGVTLGVLMGMDVLECFLHTLRLHWVEFQSKFYKADGLMFAPYSIRRLVELKMDE